MRVLRPLFLSLRLVKCLGSSVVVQAAAAGGKATDGREREAHNTCSTRGVVYRLARQELSPVDHGHGQAASSV
jgi:hypothetical protein